MEAIEFMKEIHRMCKYYESSCKSCPLEYTDCDIQSIGSNVERFNIIAAVEKWSKDHPVKTRQSEFLKLFPTAKITDGYLSINPCDIDFGHKKFCWELGGSCANCREKYWSEEVGDKHEQS